MAVRQVTQLNAGKKTPGVDGKASLKHEERLELIKEIGTKGSNWEHQKLREIPIPKKDGTIRTLKVPTMADRAWQCERKICLRTSARSNLPCQELWVQNGERSARRAEIPVSELEFQSPRNRKASYRTRGSKSALIG